MGDSTPADDADDIAEQHHSMTLFADADEYADSDSTPADDALDSDADDSIHPSED